MRQAESAEESLIGKLKRKVSMLREEDGAVEDQSARLIGGLKENIAGLVKENKMVITIPSVSLSPPLSLSLSLCISLSIYTHIYIYLAISAHCPSTTNWRKQ